ncbi:hypothetical protein PtA15_8A486 [Puccinia triticina]|uniref:Uncharacterized protein n=1 Tax=Puccinia triticina TaxID=208348 RepID=A0ABY7CXY4_9BASI|nr:uncharacterized protein PtA15_8A486 [Puccinia triticina]WAQ87582.1 hypothetical protein PtA15_8A486 [Puccinia triticina]
MCLCSNCDPDNAKILFEAFKYLTTDNFSKNITSRELLIDVPVPPKVPKVSTTRSVITAETGMKPLVGELERFAEFLVQGFTRFHHSQIGAEHSEFEPEDHFRMFEARRVVVGFCGGFSEEQLEDLSGGEAISGQTEHLLRQINKYAKKPSYLNYLEELKVQSQAAEEAKRQKVLERNEATLERRQQRVEETKRKNTEQAAERKRQKLGGQPGE